MPIADSRSLATELGEVIARLNTRLRRDIIDSGVSVARARTLATLEREGPRRLSDLAVFEQVAQPTMSVLVARLEADALVSRSGDEADGRTVVVSITPAGRSSLGRIRERRAASLQRALGQLSATDLEAIAAALPAITQLTENMDELHAVGATR